MSEQQETAGKLPVSKLEVTSSWQPVIRGVSWSYNNKETNYDNILRAFRSGFFSN
jgi:hypothetical protein